VVSTSSRLHRIVVLIWVAFFLRGAFYASILPVWEGFDEYAHFAFIHHLKTFLQSNTRRYRGGRLPPRFQI
jgi:hypothetical protein